jgi:glycosyltransferase A (GT-A) superfamily protein (DUF2064 family)
MLAPSSSCGPRSRPSPGLDPEALTIALIAKSPVAGRVKTRLCPPCRPEQAAALAAAALGDTLRCVAATRCGRRVLVLDGPPPCDLPRGLEVIAQRAGGLDERLAGAFDDLREPALLLGMDTPQLTPSLLGGALAALAEPGVDAVLGLAPDGGYWSIGLRRSDPAVFLGVPMSERVTGERQAERLAALGLTVGALPPLRDVDDFADALAVAAVAPHTLFARAAGQVAEAIAAEEPTRARAILAP